jgi:hypothetical protein
MKKVEYRGKSKRQKERGGGGDIRGGGEGEGEGYSVCIYREEPGLKLNYQVCQARMRQPPANEGPMTREMTRHRVPPGWLEESDPAG